MSKYKIVMVRHGESEWNKLNLFCGWFDADLSDKGNVRYINRLARVSCRKLFRTQEFDSRVSASDLGGTQFETQPYSYYIGLYFSLFSALYP
jgi:broad specificity phosphatase PhoE